VIEALAARAVEEAELTELPDGRRSRQRNDKASVAFRALARAVIANTVYALVKYPASPSVALPVNPATHTRLDNRYHKLMHMGHIRPVLAALGAAYGPRREGPTLVTLKRSRQLGSASVIRAGRKLQDCIASLDDFGLSWFHSEGGETIFVRRVEHIYEPGRPHAHRLLGVLVVHKRHLLPGRHGMRL
jgi:hypothetical protein